MSDLWLAYPHWITLEYGLYYTHVVVVCYLWRSELWSTTSADRNIQVILKISGQTKVYYFNIQIISVFFCKYYIVWLQICKT